MRPDARCEPCVYCGRTTFRPGSDAARDRPDLMRTIDHVESDNSPRRANTPEVIACARCNEIKAGTPVEVFRHWLAQGADGPVAQVCSGWGATACSVTS